MQIGICKRVAIEHFIINTIIEATVIESMSRAVSVGFKCVLFSAMVVTVAVFLFIKYLLVE